MLGTWPIRSAGFAVGIVAVPHPTQSASVAFHISEQALEEPLHAFREVRGRFYIVVVPTRGLSRRMVMGHDAALSK